VPAEKSGETFRVIDRRLFTPEGELRKEVLEQERREEQATKSAKPAAAVSADKSAAAPGGAEAPAPSPFFQLLIDFIARNAAALLGGYADPRTGQAIVDLEGAQELIDMLDALREKTRGNLTPDEDRLLQDVAGSLKLSYLEISKAAEQAVRQKAARKP
jgi:hypothetical protein